MEFYDDIVSEDYGNLFENHLNNFNKTKDLSPEQHNIMCFIGNGFDINVLNKYRKNDELSTTYKKFYQFLKFYGIEHTNNDLILYMKSMEENQYKIDKAHRNYLWTDFESLLPDFLETQCNKYGIEDGCKKVRENLNEIQKLFSLFLRQVVTPEIESQLGEDSMKHKLAFNSLSSFLGDLLEDEHKKMDFPKKTKHYDGYNYLFINFNYTSLFDDYIYLDKKQFDPHTHKNIDTNFEFLPDPKKYDINKEYENLTKWSSYVNTKVIHPHGEEHIPRSLLFGTNNEYPGSKDKQKFNKGYWAQYNKNYKDLFSKTELFIIYGSSVGESDKWWWEQICSSLANSKEKPELIVYSYRNEFKKEEFVNKFNKDVTSNSKVLDRIHVVDYDDSTKLYFASLE